MTAPKRTRLSPEDRRMQLLDCARTIIVERGLSSFTIDALAREAEVSIPLIYKYFETRLVILQELLKRDSKSFSNKTQLEMTDTMDYRDLVKLMVVANFEQFSSNNIVNILRDQPDVYAAIASDEKKSISTVGRFLIKMLIKQYGVDEPQAEHIVVLASGASQAAAARFNRFGGNRDALIEATVEFIFGGLDTFTSS